MVQDGTLDQAVGSTFSRSRRGKQKAMEVFCRWWKRREGLRNPPDQSSGGERISAGGRSVEATLNQEADVSFSSAPPVQVKDNESLLPLMDASWEVWKTLN